MHGVLVGSPGRPMRRQALLRPDDLRSGSARVPAHARHALDTFNGAQHFHRLVTRSTALDTRSTRPVPLHDRQGERRVRAPTPQGGRRRGRRAGGRGAGPRRTPGPRSALSKAALGRTAAARGARPRTGHTARGAAARRAVVQSRRQAARGDAVRAQAYPARDGGHLDFRHPRSGGSADAVRSDRRPRSGQGPGDRRPEGDPGGAAQCLRGRLPRRGEPDPGPRGRDRRWREHALRDRPISETC